MRLIKPSFEILASSISEDFPYSYLEPNRLIEACGRICYKSESKITKDSSDRFVDKLKNLGHLSVLEHSWGIVGAEDEHALLLWNGPRSPFLHYAIYRKKSSIIASETGKPMARTILLIAGNMRAFNERYPDLWENRMPNFKAAEFDPDLFHAVTVKIICDRGVSHELVRHRPVSYSQESTRYCDYGTEVTFVLPPWENGRQDWTSAMLHAEKLYTQLLRNGQSPQQARSVLPNSLKTEIAVTCNLREWKHIFRLRTSPKAHPQMREIMNPLYAEFKTRFSKYFDKETSDA